MSAHTAAQALIDHAPEVKALFMRCAALRRGTEERTEAAKELMVAALGSPSLVLVAEAAAATKQEVIDALGAHPGVLASMEALTEVASHRS